MNQPHPSPDDKLTHDFILKKLVGNTSDDEIIYQVCDETGMDWETARTLVDGIRAEHNMDIVVGQIPIKSAISVVYAVVGILLIVGPLIYLYIILDVTHTFVAFISGGVEMSLDTLTRLLGMRCALLSWFELPTIFCVILLGFAIVKKNYQYLIEAWTTLFP